MFFYFLIQPKFYYLSIDFLINLSIKTYKFLFIFDIY